MATIKPISTRVRKGLTMEQGGADEWGVTEILAQQPGDWIEQLVRGSPCESRALSIWKLHPNLKIATEKLAGFLTPRWPTRNGESALLVSIENAVTNVDKAIQHGDMYYARVVGIYMYWLVQCVRDVERIELRGYTRSGETHLYRHFSAPLKDWVSAQKIERIEAVKTGTAQTEEVVAGLRTHLIASITNPIDAGYFALHAPVRAA